MESMTNAPYLLDQARSGYRLGHGRMVDHLLLDGLEDPYHSGRLMGAFAEDTASHFHFTRQDQDEFALASQQKASKAIKDGVFKDQIVSIVIKGRKGDVTIDTDEGPRADTSLEGLAKLRPSFDAAGTVTAGNASQLSDGAAALVVVSEALARESRSPIKAKIIASATSGVAPKEIFIAPVSAVQKVLAKANMTLADIDLVELNEAFAAQCLACMRPLELNVEKTNVNGGAIALGHPLGCTGARLMTSLLFELERTGGRYGHEVMCCGGGIGTATIIERLN